MQKSVKLYYYDGNCETYHIPDDNWPGPVVNFMGGGFIEIEEGVYLNSKDIKRIEIVETL